MASRSKNRKEQIIEAGIQRFHADGYNASGVKDIVDTAGVPKGSFYNYFESKEAFAIETLDYELSRQMQSLEEILEKTSIPPLQRIEKFFQFMIDEYTHRYHFTLGSYAGNLAQEMADHSPAIAEKTEHYFRKCRRLIAKCIKEADKRGDLQTKIKPDDMADFILNAWEGTLLRMKSAKNGKPFTVFRQTIKNILFV